MSYIFSTGLSYPVEDVRPALQGDALEHCEHGEGKVVKVGDPIVGTLPELLHVGGPSSLR
jgi:hypothetical protein